ncbi:MAG: galactokinase [Ignavibacteriales bacterium]|nr:galactokinase [Ignavibacteriales bacterium]
MEIIETIEKKFKEIFNEEPLIVNSPGRVNLIGEHTDYNNGFVLPAAIDKSICFAITPRSDETCKLFSYDMYDSYEFGIPGFEFSTKGWPNYLMGVVDQLKKAGHKIKGFNCVFGGNIPIGAGLSSSAALEAGLIFSLNHIFNLGIDKLSLVKLAQKAENEFVGVKCGIMDQYINIFGKSGNVLRIDCRSLEYQYFPFDYKNISIVLFDTRVSHSLASSEYNQRRKECNAGVELIKKYSPQATSLRDVNVEMMKEYESKMDPVTYRRCKYVVEENERLNKACNALEVHDLKSFGSLMYQTHEGLSKDYEVSCTELDYLVELTKDNPKVYGSRMMGGGFGGCTINLIENDAINEIKSFVKEKYKSMFSIDPKIYVTKINDGTQIIRENTIAER